MLARWLSMLSLYTFHTVHRSGVTHTNADSLPGNSVVVTFPSMSRSKLQSKCNWTDSWSMNDLNKAQAEDPHILKWKEINNNPQKGQN